MSENPNAFAVKNARMRILMLLGRLRIVPKDVSAPTDTGPRVGTCEVCYERMYGVGYYRGNPRLLLVRQNDRQG